MIAKKIRNANAALERLELYCMAHSGSPTAVRRPRLFLRSGVWVALLGQSIEQGIAGFGATVEAALRAFDVQYLNALRPATERLALRINGKDTSSPRSRNAA